MAAIDDAWTCYNHPTRRRRIGVCPTCLRDRLLSLCPNCANSLPCPCFPSTTDSSSSSSSFSRFSIDSSSVGAIGRVSSLIDSEPSFRRSRSAAIPFLSSRAVPDSNLSNRRNPKPPLSSLLSVFKIFKNEMKSSASEDEMMMTRSKSVSMWRSSESGKASKPSGHKGWHFPSPMKVFRHSKPRSPLYRG